MGVLVEVTVGVNVTLGDSLIVGVVVGVVVGVCVTLGDSLIVGVNVGVDVEVTVGVGLGSTFSHSLQFSNKVITPLTLAFGDTVVAPSKMKHPSTPFIFIEYVYPVIKFTPTNSVEC